MKWGSMNKNNLFKNSLICGIVVLFVGTAVFPSINSNTIEANGVNNDSGSQTHHVSMIKKSMLDVEYIYNITKALSYIIFTEYNESAGGLAKGRFFGTKGEHKAVEILYDNMTKLGLYTKKEQIQNIKKIGRPKLSKLTHKIEILEYGLKINNETIVDFHIAPSKNGPRNNPNQLDYNFSYNGLKVYKKPKLLLPWIIKRFFSEKEDFVFIEQDRTFNPDLQLPIIKFLSHFISPLSRLLLFGPKMFIYNIERARWYNSLPHCKGLIRYDNNMNTYNYGSAGASVPIIYINGTVGKKIMEDLKHASVDFYLNQTYNDSVISYNVIGQLNGTNPNKTVIVDCLYDSWWCQGTADAAIGMAMVLGIAKYFVDNNIQPTYNIKFIGFGGEEIGVKGALYYEAAHRDENITHVIDLNQICFWQDGPRLTLNIICNKILFLREIWKVVEKTDYKEMTKDTADIKPVWLPFGAPSNDQAFAIFRPRVKTVCFLKDTGWLLHHRDGEGHNEGDVMKYFDWDDVNATGEIVLNITKYLTIEPEDQIASWEFIEMDTDNNVCDDALEEDILS